MVVQEIEVWRQLLPPCVEVSAGPPIKDVRAITEVEERSAGLMGDRRKLEFSIGRAYARHALSRLGFHEAELPMGADKAPIWPAGVTGSITHAARSGGGHFAVAVARSDCALKIGIDAEFIQHLLPKTWPQFLNARELGFVRSLTMTERTFKTSAIWCAKEAAVKATGRAMDPLDIEVTCETTNDRGLDTWRVEFPDGGSKPIAVRARTACLSEIVLGAVVLCEGGAG